MMYISKKKKMIIGFAIPATLLTAGTIVTVPALVYKDKSNFSKLNSSKNLQISLASTDEIMVSMPSFPYQPNKFTQAFFVQKIANQKYITPSNQYLDTNNFLFNFERNPDSSIKYFVQKVYQNEDKKLVADIQKSFENKKEIYTTNINVLPNYFEENDQVSQNNFLAVSSKKIKEFMYSGQIQLKQTSLSSEIDSIKQDELTIESDSKFVMFSKDETDLLYYANRGQENFDSSLFWYLANMPVEFNAITNIDSTRTIWNFDQAYPIDQTTGEFDQANSIAFQFLMTISDKLVLPELTNEESNGLNDSQILEKKIQKFIFNPLIDPSTLSDDGEKLIPNSNNQAILVKTTLKTANHQSTNIEKYILVWKNLFSNINNSVLDLAEEIQYQTIPLNNNPAFIWPTAQQLLDKNNWYLLTPTKSPKPGFEYNIINVEVPEEGKEFQDQVKLTIRITCKGVENYRDYTYTINKNITSIPQEQLNTNIYNYLKAQTPNDLSNYSSLIPTISINSSGFDNIYELRDKLNSLIKEQNLSEFNKIVNVSLPNGLPSNLQQVIYNPTYVSVDQILNVVKIDFVLAIKDKEKIFNSNYEIIVNGNYQKNNKI